jgi:hypothetical protein
MLRLDLDAMVAGLDAIGDGLSLAATDAPMRDIADACAERGAELVLDGFASQQTPDGTGWARRKSRLLGHPILDLTGDLKNSSECEPGPRVDSQGFSLTFAIRDEKAIFHQGGTKRGIPPRKMLFEDGGGAPTPWIAALDETGQTALDAWLAAHLKG